MIVNCEFVNFIKEIYKNSTDNVYFQKIEGTNRAKYFEELIKYVLLYEGYSVFSKFEYNRDSFYLPYRIKKEINEINSNYYLDLPNTICYKNKRWFKVKYSYRQQYWNYKNGHNNNLNIEEILFKNYNSKMYNAERFNKIYNKNDFTRLVNRELINFILNYNTLFMTCIRYIKSYKNYFKENELNTLCKDIRKYLKIF